MNSLSGRRHTAFLILLVSSITIVGCAEIDPFEAPAEVIRHPLGSESVKVGMSKEEVIANWGEPDIRNNLAAQDASGSQGEEWVYKARRYTPVPLDAAYLHNNKYLYFDGNNLQLISSEPKTKTEK